MQPHLVHFLFMLSYNEKTRKLKGLGLLYFDGATVTVIGIATYFIGITAHALEMGLPLWRVGL